MSDRLYRLTYIVLCAAGLLSLSGCLSPEEVTAQRAERDDAECRSYGLSLGSPAYADCRMRIQDRRQAERMQQDRLRAEANAQRQAQAQADERARNAQLQQILAQPQTLRPLGTQATCISSPIHGGSVRTVCQ